MPGLAAARAAVVDAEREHALAARAEAAAFDDLGEAVAQADPMRPFGLVD